MAIIRHMRRSAFFPGRPGGLIREITWKGNMQVGLSDEKRKTLGVILIFLRKEKRFRSISNRVSFPPGEIRKISADIKSKKNCRGEADPHGKRIAGDED